jgi:hypothetical protein
MKSRRFASSLQETAMLHPRLSLFGVAAGAIFFAAASQAHADFPLKDGDIWVMAGDSITAQHLHSNYFEASATPATTR